MAFKPAEREVTLKLSQPRFIGVFFACHLPARGGIVQKLLQLQSFTFCAELSLRSTSLSYNLLNGALFFSSLLSCLSD